MAYRATDIHCQTCSRHIDINEVHWGLQRDHTNVFTGIEVTRTDKICFVCAQDIIESNHPRHHYEQYFQYTERLRAMANARRIPRSKLFMVNPDPDQFVTYRRTIDGH